MAANDLWHASNLFRDFDGFLYAVIHSRFTQETDFYLFSVFGPILLKRRHRGFAVPLECRSVFPLFQRVVDLPPALLSLTLEPD
jgi:hypothetical protein